MIDHVGDSRWESLLEPSWQDLRYAVRSLRRAPRFAAIVILTMALGVGATTVVFSVIYNVLVDPLPDRNFARAVVFSIRATTDVGGWKGRNCFSVLEFAAIREQNHVFEDLIG